MKRIYTLPEVAPCPWCSERPRVNPSTGREVVCKCGARGPGTTLATEADHEAVARRYGRDPIESYKDALFVDEAVAILLWNRVAHRCALGADVVATAIGRTA